jgi:hypothetical protein
MAATTASERCHPSDRTQPAVGQSRASIKWGALRVAGLCIGVNNYKYTSVLPVLSNAVRDAEQVNAMLNAVPNCRSDVVIDPTIKMDLKAKIRNRLQESSLQAKPPGLFWLYYAGHAIAHSNGKVYLVPTDAKLEHPDDYEDECLGLDSVMKLLRDELDVPVLQKLKEIVFLVVLDSCRSTVHDRAARTPINFEPPADSSPRKYTLYFSCSRTRTASDGPSGGHSPFTQALLDEQHGFFAEGVTLDDAIAHVSRSLQGSRFESQRPIRLGPPDSIPPHFCIRPGPTAGGGTAHGSSAGAGGRKRKWQVDADVLALLSEWKLDDQAERLAEIGVCEMEDLELMKEEHVQKFRLSLQPKFFGLLQHVATQKEKRLSGGITEQNAGPTGSSAGNMAESAKGVTERAELDAKSRRELLEICRTKEIDSSTCFEKRDLVDLIIKAGDTDCFLAQLKSLETQGDAPAILQGMLTHSGYAAVQRQVCAALKSLADNTAGMRVKIAKAGGIEAIIAAMKAHNTNASVQEQACGALASLVDKNARNPRKISGAGGIQVVVAAMKAHGGNASLQQNACAVLASLGENVDNEGKMLAVREIVAVRGIETVVAAMKAHEGSALVQEQACAVFNNLCPHGKEFIKTAGGVERIKHAVSASYATAKTKRWGKSLLEYLV